MLIMIDGIDGSGKSTVVQTWKEYLTAQGNAVFDLKQYWQTTGKYPELDEIKSYDFVFSCEPTYVGVGKVIREELVKIGTNYPHRAIIEAFSLDRLVLYNKITIPLLASGKIVIQDRGVSTSLAYQSLQDKEFDFAKIAEFPGNKLALENRPDHLIIAQISAEQAAARIGARFDKNDNAIFEKLDFLKKAAENFSSSEFQKIFTDRGTQIHRLNAGAEIDIMKQEATNLLKQLISA
ncbi:MAG: Thymidylate kinase [Parcubacteria group bacterium Gr01-1014_13]|nr:MAG: Thymidylate kinase [Parcubacteria group bacterium Gr01-1014_13]